MLIRSECRVESEEPSRQDDGVLQRPVRMLGGDLLTLLDDEPGRLWIGDSLDEKPAEALTRRIEAWTIVEPADHGQYLADGNVHEISRGGAQRWRLTRQMISTARGRAMAHPMAWHFRLCAPLSPWRRRAAGP